MVRFMKYSKSNNYHHFLVPYVKKMLLKWKHNMRKKGSFIMDPRFLTYVSATWKKWYIYFIVIIHIS